MRRFAAFLLSVSLLVAASSANARSSGYQSFNKAGRGGTSWQGFSPTWIVGLSVWMRGDLGVTSTIGPVTATGTTPPTVTLSGAPSQSQTVASTPYVELDCTTLGVLGVSKFTVKVNGAVTATNVVSAASGVTLTGSGLTAGWAAGASATDDVYTANVVASAWASAAGARSFTQATASHRPTYVQASASYASHASLSFATASSQSIIDTVAITLPQPDTFYVVGRSTSGAGNYAFVDASGGAIQACYSASGAQDATMYGGSFVASSTAVSSPSVMAFVFNGASSAIYVTNSASSVASGNVNANGIGTIAIGGANRGAGFLTGDVVDIILTSSADDAATRWRLFTFESSVYGVPAR